MASELRLESDDLMKLVGANQSQSHLNHELEHHFHVNLKHQAKSAGMEILETCITSVQRLLEDCRDQEAADSFLICER